MTMPTPPVLNRVHPVIWATLAMLAAAAVLMAPACSALQEASKEVSSIGRAGKAVEGQADGVQSDAQAAKDALARARETGGVSPEAEPFRRGGGDGDRLNPGSLWGDPWLGSGDTGAGIGNPSALDGGSGQSAGVDGRGEVGIDWRGLPGGAWSGDLPGDWGFYAPDHQGGGQPGKSGDGQRSEAGRRGDGSSADRPGGGPATAPAGGDAGPSLRSILRRLVSGGEDAGGGTQDAAAYPRYGPRIALAGLSDAGYLDLIVCFWLAMFGQWLAGKAGVGSGNILKRLLAWLATATGAVVEPSTSNKESPNASPSPKPPGE